MSDQYDPQKEAFSALTEVGTLGTLIGSATTLSSVGTVTVATLTGAAGVTTIAVSLPAVAAVGAALYVGASLGNRFVKAMNVAGNASNEDGRSVKV